MTDIFPTPDEKAKRIDWVIDEIICHLELMASSDDRLNAGEFKIILQAGWNRLVIEYPIFVEKKFSA